MNFFYLKMANNISASISGDCEVIVIKVTSLSDNTDIQLSASRNGNAIQLTPNSFPAGSLANGQILSLSFTASQLQSTEIVGQTGTAAELSGVYVFTATQGNTVSQAGVLAACNLDCCIGNEINDYMNCPCDPSKSPKIEKATKVFLLREGAKADLSASILNPDNALTKFNKANEICDSSCGCGC